MPEFDSKETQQEKEVRDKISHLAGFNLSHGMLNISFWTSVTCNANGVVILLLCPYRCFFIFFFHLCLCED